MKCQFSVVKIVLLLLAFCVTGLLATAQQSHFMYIQSDNKAPFYVVLDKKTYNSNGTGYLIVSKIAAGEHTFTLGFPDNKYPTQAFSATINDADAGYALKNYGEKGWGLYNLQSMAVIMGVPLKQKSQPATDQTQPKSAISDQQISKSGTPAGNQFGDMLSQVVGDPTLQQKTTQPATQPAKKPLTKEPDSKEPVAAAEITAKEPSPRSDISDQQISKSPAVVPDDAADNAATRGVIKAGEKAGKEGVGYTFIDFNNKGADTVKIFIPTADETVETLVIGVDSAVGRGIITGRADSVKTETGREDKRAARKKKKDPEFVETDAATAAATTEGNSGVSNPFYTKPAPTTITEETTSKSDTLKSAISDQQISKSSSAMVSYNSNCSGGMAVEKDLDKLKKKMVGEEGDDKMIAVAKKGFKSKCYTTEQIKELGRLFYTDESRYAFYDAAYPFVYDINNFISLEKMLLDDYYKKRFRAMLRM